jgi:hypothetical protein
VERLTNNALTTLNGAINNSVTTITVTTGSVLPAEGDFRIVVNDEIMLVTARSTNDLTVVRGAEGTTAASQADGAMVRMVVTAGALNQWMDDITAGYSDRYPHRFLDDTGVTQTVSSFTWTNQSTATATDETWGGITMTAPSVASFNFRLLTQTAPTAPWKLTGHLQFGPGYTYFSTNGSMMGICARESSSGKIQSCALRIGDKVAGWQWTNPTLFSGTLGTSFDHRSDNVWVQLEDNNTNIIARCSSDGINWFELGSEARGTFPTGTNMDEVGFFCDSASANANALFHITSWILE